VRKKPSSLLYIEEFVTALTPPIKGNVLKLELDISAFFPDETAKSKVFWLPLDVKELTKAGASNRAHNMIKGFKTRRHSCPDNFFRFM